MATGLHTARGGDRDPVAATDNRYVVADCDTTGSTTAQLTAFGVRAWN